MTQHLPQVMASVIIKLNNNNNNNNNNNKNCHSLSNLPVKHELCILILFIIVGAWRGKEYRKVT